MEQTSFQILLNGYFAEQLTEAQKQQFYAMLEDQGAQDTLAQELLAQWQEACFEDDLNLDEALAQRIKKAIMPKPVRRMPWLRWVAAASIIAALLICGWFYLQTNETNIIAPQSQQADLPAPQNTRAYLTLANGSRIYLDSAATGTLTQQNGVEVVKNSKGEIAYEPKQQTAEAVMNTLVNPRGSQVVTVALADGSRVWLNAGSSLSYPSAFTGAERRVSIEGEGYFSIAKNAAQPFIVNRNELDIKVLGTELNVNAYADEPLQLITLVNGSIEVQQQGQKVRPAAAQQVVAGKGLSITEPDMDAVLAWKQGKFIFTGNTIQAVMRQLARWYDVDVVYQGNISQEEFVGVLSRSRNENIGAVLNMIEKTRVVKFKREGRRIIVSSYP